MQKKDTRNDNLEQSTTNRGTQIGNDVNAGRDFIGRDKITSIDNYASIYTLIGDNANNVVVGKDINFHIAGLRFPRWFVWFLVTTALIGVISLITFSIRNIFEVLPTATATILPTTTQISVPTFTSPPISTATLTPIPTSTPVPSVEFGSIYFYAGRITEEDRGSLTWLDVLPSQSAEIAAGIIYTATHSVVFETSWLNNDVIVGQTNFYTSGVGLKTLLTQPPEIAPGLLPVFVSGYVDLVVKVKDENTEIRKRIFVGSRPTIWPITLCEGVDKSGSQWQPINPKVKFEQGIREIYILYKVADIKFDKGITIIWEHEGEVYNRGKFQPDGDNFNGQVFTSVNNKDNTPLPVGMWQVYLSIDGQTIEQSRVFIIE